jgi:hypothetical protein
MARTNKKGLDYFPMNVDFFDDDKIQLIESEFGLKGSNIAIRLLCKIYKMDYYYQWGTDQCLLFAKTMGNGVVPNLVSEVVKGLVKRGFFDESVFNSFGVLTSKGIQNRYFDAVVRFKKVDVIKEYLLIDVSKMINVNINSINVYINPINVNTCTHNGNGNESESESESIALISPPKNPIFENIKKNFNVPIFECKKEFMSDKIHIYRLEKNFGIDIPLFVDEFFTQLELEGVTEKSVMDAKSHFTRWYQQKQKSNGNIKNNSGNKIAINPNDKSIFC